MINPFTGMIEYVEPGFRLFEGETLNEIIEQINAINGMMIELAPNGKILSIDDSGKIFSNETATAEAMFILPEAAAGLKFGFVVEDSHGIQFISRSGQVIYIGDAVSSSGGTASSTNVGAFIQILAINATKWITIASTSVWTLT